MPSSPGKPAQSPQEAFAALQALRVARNLPEARPEAHRAYERARNALASANQGLVVRLAKRWVCAGAELEDLVQEGALGLLEALDKFDTTSCPTHTNVARQFCTFAAVYINGAIARSRPRNTLGRLSMGEHAVRYAEKIAMEDSKSWQQTGNGLPAVDGNSSGTGQVEAKANSHSRNHAESTVEAMRAWRAPVASLDAPCTNRGAMHEGSTLHDRLSDQSATNPEEAYAAKEERARVIDALKELEPVEARLLGWRFGLPESEVG